jgi:hypothetical protein
MFDVTTVQNGLTGLVGIRQPQNPTYAILDATNTQSDSGLYLDNVSHFKTEYLIDTIDYKDASDAEKNTFITNMQKSAISTIMYELFGEQSYIDRNFIYSEATTRQTPESGITNGFVGFEIEPSKKKNLGFEITRVRLEFQGTGTVKLLLFNSNKNAPLLTKDVTITDSDQVEELNWYIDSTDGDYKGKYYFGYIYDGSLVPFKRDFEDSNRRNSISQLKIKPSYVTGANDATIFDLDQVFELSENTGLNPDITVYDDYTDLILQNKRLFARAIQLQWGIDAMRNYISTPRSNRNERLSKDVMAQTLQAIEGSTINNPLKVTGLTEYLGDEIIKLRKTVEQLKRGYFGYGVEVITAN